MKFTKSAWTGHYILAYPNPRVVVMITRGLYVALNFYRKLSVFYDSACMKNNLEEVFWT